MKLSARNQLPGTVQSITLGAVMAEVVVKLDGGEELTSAITANSVRSLGIQEGGRVYVVVKATEVMLGVD
ncbi:MAG: TOBE domain-containing protein [Caldilineaceae bacterium]|jgi:molybdate transport system regulatory protein|uniref:TOBE domain-containing protein n=1 Tax=Caldilinea sp. TaxID=2293560 RepID=UPI001A08C4DC|nr:TOBE domain-containing protein [Caldilineaceae bacterium]MBK8798393.1 TOBE domain-containing protein [Anaerolineales bacterium]HQY90076.1 TOBE domain-containing protein [Caldilinea sp.]HRA65310.1 TOBE domain-containing protein [Caldilinea sp.]